MRIYSYQLRDAIEDLVSYIETCETAVFSASIAKVQRWEAEVMAAEIIQKRCYQCSYESNDEVLINLLTQLRFGGDKCS